MADNLHFYAPIEKADEEQHMVYGYASTEALDSQGEIVTKDALAGALDNYMEFANIREMHQPSAVGKTKKAQLDKKGLYIAAKIVDPLAWEKVKEGVYKGFSIGGRVEKQVGNEITGLKLSEISLVDRPANPEAIIDVFKADGMDEVEKRDFTEAERKTMAENGQAMPDGSFPIANEEDLHNAIRAYGRAKNKVAAKKHIIARAKEMGMTSALPDDWKTTKAETVEMKKSIWQADYLIDLACNLSGYIMNEAYAGEDIEALKGALQTIKQAAASELNEEEQYPELTVAVEMAEKATNLSKTDQAPTTGVVATASTDYAPATPADPATPGVDDTPANGTYFGPTPDTGSTEVVTTNASGAIAETTITSPDPASGQGEVEAPKTNVDAAVPNEVDAPKTEQKQVSEKTEMEKIEDALKEGKMPTDEQCEFLIKSMDEEVSDRTMGMLKYQLAGKILEYISEQHEQIVNKDAAEAEVKKAQESGKDITETRKHEFDNIKVLVNKLEKAMNEQAMNAHNDQEVAKPKDAEEAISPAEKLNQILAMLQAVAREVAEQNQGNSLSPKDRKNSENGYREGSDGNNGGTVNPTAIVATPSKAQGTDTVAVQPGKSKVDMPELQKAELAKLEAELVALKDEIKKLADQPMPVKAYAGYATVEKFEKSDTENKKIELEKAEKRADELQELMKTDNTIAVLKEAEELSKTILRLRREV